jgi:O-antigen ligase
MERLTFGYGVPRRQVDSPEIRQPAQPLSEDHVRPSVLDPLPGESSDWAYFGLLAFTAVLFFRPQDQLPVLERLHLAEVSAVIGLAAMSVKRLVRRLPLVSISPELIGLVTFGLVLVATTPFSFWPGGSVEVLTGLYLKVLLIVVLMINSLNTPLRLRRFTWLIVLASAYISLRAVLDYVRGVNIVEGSRVAGAVRGIFGNPNDLALNMVAFLPFAALLALLATRAPRAIRGAYGPKHGGATGPSPLPVRSARRTRPGRPAATGQRLAAGLAVLLMLMAIVFTKSRGGFLGLAAMIVVLVYYGQRLKPGVAAAAIVLLVALVPLLPSSFWMRMSSITDPSEDQTGSRAARRQVMIEAAEVFVDRPLTGIGAGQFKNYNPPDRLERWREAHDVWLQVASETGIFGLLTFGYLVAAAFRAAFWSRRRLAAYGQASKKREAATPSDRAPTEPDAASPVPAAPGPQDSTDLGILHLHASALVPSLVGWFVCAIFASVAYNWTFYYLLGLSIVTRDLTRDALAARSVETASIRRARSMPRALAS